MKPFEYKVKKLKTGEVHLSIQQALEKDLVDQFEHTQQGLEELSDLWWGVIRADSIGSAIELLKDQISELIP